MSEVSNSNEAKRIIIKEIPVEKLTPETKQDYYHKMLNAVYKVSWWFIMRFVDMESLHI